MLKVPDVAYVRHLYVQQRKADTREEREAARRELIDLTKKMQSVANSRLRSLRKSDYAYGTTYDTTEAYLEQRGKKYFTLPNEAKTRGAKRSETGEPYALTNTTYDYALRLMGFVRSKESTVGGQRAIEAKRFATYRRDHPETANMTDSVLRDFIKFMGNAGFSEYLNYNKYDSGQQMEEFAKMYEYGNDAEIRKLEALFNSFAEYQKQAAEVEEGTREEIDEGYLSPTMLDTKLTALRADIRKRYEKIEERSR